MKIFQVIIYIFVYFIKYTISKIFIAYIIP